MKRPIQTLLFLCAFGLAACGGSDDPVDAGSSGTTQGPDAGPVDDPETKPDAGPVEEPEAKPDAGPAEDFCTANKVAPEECVGECDPIQNRGCTQAGSMCQASFMRDTGECVEAGDHSKKFGEACDFSLRNCGPGLVCSGGHGGMGGSASCVQICYAKTLRGCESLGADYVCDPKKSVPREGGSKLAMCVKKEA